MRYFNFELFESLDPGEYWDRRPCPWSLAEGLIHAEGYARLLGTLPGLDLFSESFGVRRKHGQQAHDRYSLEYTENLPVAREWHEFLRDLRSERYRAQLCRLMRVPSVTLNFHWHYTPEGCQISPHTDSVRKAGSQIFYFNTGVDWQPEWGGETLLLEPTSEIRPKSAPGFDHFTTAVRSPSIGNRSLLFSRTDRSWHGMRPLRCPPDRLRKVFIVVVNHDRWPDRLRQFVRRKPVALY